MKLFVENIVLMTFGMYMCFDVYTTPRTSATVSFPILFYANVVMPSLMRLICLQFFWVLYLGATSRHLECCSYKYPCWFRTCSMVGNISGGENGKISTGLDMLYVQPSSKSAS